MTPEQRREAQELLARCRWVGQQRQFWDDVLCGRPVKSLLDPAELMSLALMRMALLQADALDPVGAQVERTARLEPIETDKD